ncbi:MAG: response regulator transcription factor [Anaerocolumna sp.]
MSDSKKILVIEDEIKIIEFVESYLISNGYTVITAQSGRRGLALYSEEKPDLVLLDLMLPDISGEQICKEIRKTSKLPIIMLTAKSSEESIISGLNMGADDYITKPFSPRQMVARVNALLRRTYEKEEKDLNIYHGDLMIDYTNYSVKKKGSELNLTPSEYKILLTLAKRPSKVFTREELIQIAFDGDFLGYDRTIDSHIKNLRAKIEDNPKESTYIKTIRGIGYRFGGE